jgi:hypothetical protein
MKKLKPTKSVSEFVLPPVRSATFDVDAVSDLVPEEALSLGGTRKVVSKPDISLLPDAIEGGMPQFGPGDKIVIERYASFLKGNPYLDTRTYKVIDIDAFTGKMHLYDESLNQNAVDNWKTGIKSGNVYKLAMGNAVTTKKKRGRPRKNPIEAPKLVDPTVPKRGRGRPKGVKNRAKDVIAAEKAAASIVKAAKKAATTAAKKKRSVR